VLVTRQSLTRRSEVIRWQGLAFSAPARQFLRGPLIAPKLLEPIVDTHSRDDAARSLLDRHGLTDWRVSIENLRTEMYTAVSEKGLLGYCCIPSKTIRLDWRVGRRFRQILLHEIAHALVGYPGHGAEWLSAAKRITRPTNS
jgi:hypothetical protein